MKLERSMVALFAAVSSPALALACGGHGGGGGGGHGGGGGAGGRSGARACVEGSAIVGRQSCARFGALWNVARTPEISFESALTAGAIDLSRVSASGRAEHPDANHPFSVAQGALNVASPAFGLALRLNGGLGGGLYLAVQLDLAIASARGAPLRFGDLVETPRTALRVGAGVAAGYRYGVGPVNLRAEVLAGVSATSLTFDSAYGACAGTASVFDVAARVEPRVSVEARLTPWTTLGVSGGTNALSVGDWSTALYMRFSALAYDGSPPVAR